jgi:hypothetical protein
MPKVRYIRTYQQQHQPKRRHQHFESCANVSHDDHLERTQGRLDLEVVEDSREPICFAPGLQNTGGVLLRQSERDAWLEPGNAVVAELVEPAHT